LRQELGLHGDVEPADVVDELTFIHGKFTFENERTTGPAKATATNQHGPRYGIGQVLVST
jgi:hypothetical protein